MIALPAKLPARSSAVGTLVENTVAERNRNASQLKNAFGGVELSAAVGGQGEFVQEAVRKIPLQLGIEHEIFIFAKICAREGGIEKKRESQESHLMTRFGIFAQKLSDLV